MFFSYYKFLNVRVCTIVSSCLYRIRIPVPVVFTSSHYMRSGEQLIISYPCYGTIPLAGCSRLTAWRKKEREKKRERERKKEREMKKRNKVRKRTRKCEEEKRIRLLNAPTDKGLANKEGWKKERESDFSPPPKREKKRKKCQQRKKNDFFAIV